MRGKDLKPWFHSFILRAKSKGEQPLRSPRFELPWGTFKRILLIRTDSIGDGILATSLVPELRKAAPGASITVVCQDHVAAVWQELADDILVFNASQFKASRRHRKEIKSQLRIGHFDVALNTVCSRTGLSDELAFASEAPIRVAFSGDFANLAPQREGWNNWRYTHLLPIEKPGKPEMLRHQEFLTRLGWKAPLLQPRLTLTPEEQSYAERVFAEHGLDPHRTVALFAGAQHEIKFYERYGEALGPLVQREGLRVLALGGPADALINQANLSRLPPGPHVDLTGQSSLRETAALLAHCRMAVGADTGLAHLACALGVPQAIVLGGGHFGRFLPYSPLTAVACLPLACFGCNWQCPYERVHCVKDVPPGVLEAAIEAVWSGAADEPRCFYPEALPPKDGWPPPVDPAHWLSGVLLTSVPGAL
ncbi:glycosyltransferase family 9 protein [Geothrix sp. PMB-07]|uniref:glycosyltransferase family 9 protein n=1 Tax=Geothrix sp. PMB-07 TaxID=3068640 RepID=UPI002740B22E|nr:glycosyltransferase family 9 protein [Geothrix sp. PMB-07]WLT33239.1 glycosyltransferase family 9 protein [Geothrix sp. PMB-07]